MMLFLQCAFSSLEIDLVRKQVQTLVSLHVWHCLSEVCLISLYYIRYKQCKSSFSIHKFFRAGGRMSFVDIQNGKSIGNHY